MTEGRAILTLKRVIIQGFRGFRDEQQFALDGPVTLLFGLNHSGKSSTLNAIEWALFGSKCSGNETTIRERVDWVVPNRYMDEIDTCVELELAVGDDTYLVRRSLCPPSGNRRIPAASLQLILPSGEKLDEVIAEQRLSQFLRSSSFRDFMTMVYQHQETVRAILTQEARFRDDAIDRLLGLADHRNLLAAVRAAGAPGEQKAMQAPWDGIEDLVKFALRGREEELRQQKALALDAGIRPEELNSSGALDAAAAADTAITRFTSALRIEPPPLPVPKELSEAPLFLAAAKNWITQMRCGLPAFEDQTRLLGCQQEFIRLRAALEGIKKIRTRIGEAVRELDKKYRGNKNVEAQLGEIGNAKQEEEGRLREANGRLALVGETITYMQRRLNEGAQSHQCPVCEQDAPNLLERLRHQWDKELSAPAKLSQAAIETLRLRQGEFAEAKTKYEALDGQWQEQRMSLEEAHRQIGEFLSQEFGADDDPEAKLASEGECIERQLEDLRQAIGKHQETLGRIQGSLDKASLICEFLRLQEKPTSVEEIKESPEYDQVESVRNEIAEYASDLEAITEAIRDAARDEAREKLAASEAAIDRYFRRMTGHPAVQSIKVKLTTNARTQANSYRITDQDERDLTPILSQGDLNALALAMFLGLAVSSAEGGPFGFVLMDDPSQSLDDEHKKHLVSVLNEVTAQKQLVLGTMDREFRDSLVAGLSKSKVEYRFNHWSVEEGPSISKV